jgi:hypothetical protein
MDMYKRASLIQFLVLQPISTSLVSSLAQMEKAERSIAGSKVVKGSSENAFQRLALQNSLSSAAGVMSYIIPWA